MDNNDIKHLQNILHLVKITGLSKWHTVRMLSVRLIGTIYYTDEINTFIESNSDSMDAIYDLILNKVIDLLRDKKIHLYYLNLIKDTYKQNNIISNIPAMIDENNIDSYFIVYLINNIINYDELFDDFYNKVIAEYEQEIRNF